MTRSSKAGAVRVVAETQKPIARVARELGINDGTLGQWCAQDRRRRDGGNGALGESERAELVWSVPGLVDTAEVCPCSQTEENVFMGSTRRSFTDEYKRDAVTLITEGGYSVSEVAKKGSPDVSVGQGLCAMGHGQPGRFGSSHTT